MLLRKILLSLYALYALNGSISIFCMKSESPEPKSNQPESVFLWSTYFKNDAIFKKSFVFDVQNSDEKIIVITTTQTTYLFLNKNGQWYKIPLLHGYFADIEQYIPCAFMEDKSYTFYYATKTESTLFSNKKHIIQKITIGLNLPSKSKSPTKQPSSEKSLLTMHLGHFDTISIDPLPFEHNTPIMHLDMCIQNKKKYLIAGSFYPSIKIYDFEQEKVIKTLHNRFLLGVVNDTIYYAKKVDPRPYFGLQRSLAYGLSKQYNCKLYTLREFDKNAEIQPKYKENISIDFQQYPQMIGKSGEIFDRKKNVIIDPKNQGILFNLLPVAFEMERGEQIDHAKVNRQKIIELFQNDKLWTYFQNTMTYKSFIDFAYKNPTKNVIDYFNSIITPIVQAIIPPKSASCKDIKNLIINNCVFMATYNFKGGIDDMPFTKESFDHLKKSILPDAFNLKNSLLGVDEQKNIKKSVLYEPKYIIQDIKNVHLHNQSIIVQTQNDIFYGMLTNDSTIFEAYYTAEHEIDNSYIAGNTLFIIDKNGLYQLELPQQLIQQEITIQQERSEELYSPTTIKEIETLITALKTDKAISVLKGLFENFDQFQIYSTDDIPNMQGIRGEGGITDCVKTGCLKPILNAWIFGIAENNNLSFGSDNEFTQIINILEEKVNDLNMWFTGLKEKDIFHNLKKSFLSYQDRTYHPNNKPEVLAEVLKRFPLLNSKTIAEEAYNEYLRSLSLCYAMETVEFEIDGQNQTYLKYARNHFKNRADKIKGLEIDPFVILHRALRKKSN